MRALVAAWRLARLAPHVLHGLWIVRRRFDLLTAAEKHGLVQWWSLKTLRILGIALRAQGQALPAGHLIVANHVSWLDIAAVHAVLPQARFVSKADVKHWPLVGSLAEGAGTLFIERSSKRDALRVVHQTAAALQAGDCVAVFPEGTTGAGPQLLPFHANLLQAAVSTGAPVLPVVLRWFEPGERFSPAARFIGETTLAQSLWRIASARGLGIEVQILPSVEPQEQDRRALGEALREAISARL
ncbi:MULTISPECIES: lysophospholipid acyltransferase family protein [Roseateles]|uniref:1-acyl-sn-glycerol-3-phosphate acyltransferase n=1 Tax=Pelomonas caseinilytica TaxID=2906763 RepID=A0ABS8XH54_9BURK|nr:MULTISPECIES: lysophospholipid acyltransferase family protein [unclassified Roseateles]MCE4538353.1 1-acyl-sn-glycerol-3-phosphate acyltransferase [Pelomonas sp. P7]HEV6964759.1 lysophospholipid acyltransferase family protein [Roseateles sp.]